MRALLLVLVLALAMPAAGQPTTSTRTADAMAIALEVTGQAIYDGIAELTQDAATGYRMVGTASHDAARAWIEARFAAAGLEPVRFEHDCVIGGAPNPTGLGGVPGVPFPEPQHIPSTSVLALVEGRSRTDWVVIGGHYDTREDSTGALDNAAGTSMVLELAEAFQAHAGELERSVLLVAWDCEEWGVWGSREFMARLPEVEARFGLANGSLRLHMAVSLDMPGLNWPARNVWGTYHKGEYSVMHVRTSPLDTFGYKAAYGEYNRTNYTDPQLAGFRAYREVVKHAAYDLLDYPERWVWVEDDTHGRSDHVPFIAAGVPGMRVHGPSDEEYPPYHKPADTLAAADYSAGGRELFVQGLESAARLTALTAALVALPAEGGPAGAPEPQAVPGAGAALLAVAIGVLAGSRRRA